MQAKKTKPEAPILQPQGPAKSEFTLKPPSAKDVLKKAQDQAQEQEQDKMYVSVCELGYDECTCEGNHYVPVRNYPCKNGNAPIRMRDIGQGAYIDKENGKGLFKR